MLRFRLHVAVCGIASLILIATPSRSFAGGILFVDDNAPLGGDGASWDTAYRLLHDALVAANGGNVSEIHIGQGTYRPDRDENFPVGTGDREATFQLVSGVVLMGGYAGIVAKDPDARDIELYQSVLEGNIGVPELATDNSLHVVTAQPMIQASSLDGLTIRNGRADDGDLPHGKDGGGILNDGGEISLTNCKLKFNYGLDFGAGVYVGGGGTITATNCSFVENVGEDGGGITAISSTVVAEDCIFQSNFATLGAGVLLWGDCDGSFIDCTFTDNTTSFYSGAVEVRIQSTAHFDSCIFENNIAGNDGGAVRVIESTADITNCTFVNNEAGNDKVGGALKLGDSVASITHTMFVGNTAYEGGAIYLRSSELVLLDCEFRSNIAWTVSGAVLVGNSLLEAKDCLFEDNHAIAEVAGAVGIFTGLESVITNCTFIGNTASIYGGALRINTLTTPQITNCLFIGNEADRGAAMAIHHVQPNLINCTFANNIAAVNGGGFYSLGSLSSTTMSNCIFWGNSDSGGIDESAQIFISDGDLDIDFSCIQGLTGGLGGIGNVDNDPLFVDPGSGDLRLSPGSPCIDAADNTAVPKGTDTDLDGEPRFIDDPCTDDTGNGESPIVDMGAYEFQVTCPWDLDCSGDVGVKDLLFLLGAWGPCPKKGDCPADFDDSGDVGVKDLLALLGNWGPCP